MNKNYLSKAKWSTLLLAAAGMLVLCSPSQKAATKEKEITDYGIMFAVENGLLLEKGVFPNDVDVGTAKGIVTLSGSVDNLLAKERAVKIAESIRGVRGVIDLVTVTTVSRPDADIQKDIQTALLQDPATASYRVAVSVQGGVATLTGIVGSFMEKQLAAWIAAGVKGTREIHNDITIIYQQKRTDREIAADVKARLQWDIWINGELIDVEVKDGKVTLTGKVESAINRSRAFEDAWVHGVKYVDESGIVIEPWVHNYARRKSKNATISDGDIKQAIQAAFSMDPRVSGFSPGITVEGGIVRLSGSVGNLKAKNSAEQDAKNIVGVWRVDNFLKVRSKQQITDAEMKAQLTSALFKSPLLEGSTMDAAVTNRVADLSGMVVSSFQKGVAQDIASRTRGVVSIRNHLKVEPEVGTSYYNWPYSSHDWVAPFHVSGVFKEWPYVTDEQIKKNIEEGFLWSSHVDIDDVKVLVDEGEATLTGAVGTWVGWNEIDNVAHTSGAIKVVNRVSIKNVVWLLE
jgi:osmotically-inducible protein OsmY